MGKLIRTVVAGLAVCTASAKAVTPALPSAHAAGCLDHSSLLSRAAYHPDTTTPTASCGHLLSTETVVKPRASNHT